MNSIGPFVPKDSSIPEDQRFTYTGGYWVGAVRKPVVGSHPPRKHWLWLTGEPIPNIQDDNADDCAAYYKGKGDSEATITDDKCNEKRPGYICQFDPNVLKFISNKPV